MKRLFFLLSSYWLLASTAQAQVGLRTGGGLTSIAKSSDDGRNVTTTQRKLGYQAGIFYQISLSQYLSLVPEIAFSREHFAVDNNYYFGEGDVFSSYIQSLSYLNLPILLRASLGAFYLEVGPQASLLVGGRATGTQTISGGFVAGSYSTPIDAAATTSYHRFDAGPCVGVGIKLPAGLGLGVRAYWGLTKLTKEQTSVPFGQSYIAFQHRQTLQASLTYQLPTRQ
ncbi:PorT family protein [Hymenobacter setariae]|uniref:PorT family protein n=1 Tax=Hymenobacter setariae TaxID=2594794 RepID=A0A558C418_9BACT|nr:porin family protein [Hymenobacter setariae]TVT43533.1 PorT family protein [Hymenobacter setariae]